MASLKVCHNALRIDIWGDASGGELIEGSAAVLDRGEQQKVETDGLLQRHSEGLSLHGLGHLTPFAFDTRVHATE